MSLPPGGPLPPLRCAASGAYAFGMFLHPPLFPAEALIVQAALEFGYGPPGIES